MILINPLTVIDTIHGRIHGENYILGCLRTRRNKILINYPLKSVSVSWIVVIGVL